MLFELINEGLGLVQSIAAISPIDQPLNQALVTTVQSESAAELSTGTGLSSEVVENLIPIIAIVMGCTIAIVAILASMVTNNQREKTRREIAAYVAEGSISPDDAERMMRAASTCSKS
jgi:hypothetical protein